MNYKPLNEKLKGDECDTSTGALLMPSLSAPRAALAPSFLPNNPPRPPEVLFILPVVLAVDIGGLRVNPGGGGTPLRDRSPPGCAPFRIESAVLWPHPVRGPSPRESVGRYR